MHSSLLTRASAAVGSEFDLDLPPQLEQSLLSGTDVDHLLVLFSFYCFVTKNQAPRLSRQILWGGFCFVLFCTCFILL